MIIAEIIKKFVLDDIEATSEFTGWNLKFCEILSCEPFDRDVIQVNCSLWADEKKVFRSYTYMVSEILCEKRRK